MEAQHKRQLNQFSQLQEENKLLKKYKYASIIVAKKSNHEIIKKKFQRYSIECMITTPLESLKLKGTAYSGILYHNTDIAQLLSIIKDNKDFKFDGRDLIVILITQFIRLVERSQRNVMSQVDFGSLQVWMHRQYPNETLRMWKFITDNKDEEYYLQAESKESTLYIYLVLTHFSEKTLFKNPKELKNIKDEERKSRFTQVYPIK